MSAIYLVRCGVHAKSGRPLARFYKLFMAPSLFDGWILTREWGNIGSGATVRLDQHPNAGAALLALQEIVRQQVRRGYQHLNDAFML